MTRNENKNIQKYIFMLVQVENFVAFVRDFSFHTPIKFLYGCLHNLFGRWYGRFGFCSSHLFEKLNKQIYIFFAIVPGLFWDKKKEKMPISKKNNIDNQRIDSQNKPGANRGFESPTL